MTGSEVCGYMHMLDFNLILTSYMIKNQKEKPQGCPQGTTINPRSYRHNFTHIAHPFPLDKSPRAIGGGMEHKEQKDPVA